MGSAPSLKGEKEDDSIRTSENENSGSRTTDALNTSPDKFKSKSDDATRETTHRPSVDHDGLLNDLADPSASNICDDHAEKSTDMKPVDHDELNSDGKPVDHDELNSDGKPADHDGILTDKNSEDRTEKYMEFEDMIDTLYEKIENRNTTGESIPYEDILKIIDVLKERLGQETDFTTLIKDGRVCESLKEFMDNFESIYNIVDDLPPTQERRACLKCLGDMWYDTNAVHRLTKHCMTLYPLVEDENSQHFVVLQSFTLTVGNMAVASENFSDDVCCAPGFLEFVQTNLSYISTEENAAKDKGRLPIHYAFTAIVNSCCELKNITLFRKLDFQTVFWKLLHHECWDMRISVVQCLSKIMNEEESKMFQTHVNIISNLINFLNQAVNSPLRRAETTGPLATGYPATGVADRRKHVAKY